MRNALELFKVSDLVSSQARVVDIDSSNQCSTAHAHTFPEVEQFTAQPGARLVVLGLVRARRSR